MSKHFILCCLVLFTMSTYVQRDHDVQLSDGDQWLKMTNLEREGWIKQFIVGYNFAARQICDFVENDFQPDNTKFRAAMKRTGKTPREVCLDKTYHFSHANRSDPDGEYNFYSMTVSSFYEENAEYRTVPPIVLLIRLSDEGDRTVADLLMDVQKGRIKH